MDISPAFLLGSLPHLVDQAPRAGGVREWFVSGSYTVEAEVRGLKFVNIHIPDFLPFLLFDYSRFALSSYESIAASFKPYFDNRALAWPLLKQYYSAFFGAHALLRTQGRGIIRLGQLEISTLQPLARAVISSNYSLLNGNYDFRFRLDSSTTGSLIIHKRQHAATHEDFWLYFYKFLSEFSTETIQNGVPNGGLIVARIDELQKLLQGPENTGGKWLSAVRNDLNYRHQFGAWFPFNKIEKSAGPKSNIFKQNNSAIVLTHNPKSDPLSAFRSAICFISLLNADLAKQLQERSASKKANFYREWNRLANSLGAG